MKKAKQARIVGILMNGIDIASAKEHVSVSGDGTTDHEIMSGMQEFFSNIHEIIDDEGKQKTICLDGFLKSLGLSSEAEAETCHKILALMRDVFQKAKDKFAKDYPGMVGVAKYLGSATLVEDISLAFYKHFKSDGAASAQKWARLMGERKKKDIYDRFSAEELDQLDPQKQAMLFWYVVTNCTMHNFNLGGTHGKKAAREVTAEKLKGAVERLKEEGHTVTHFNYCPLVSQMLHTSSKYFSTSEGYAFGKAHAHKIYHKQKHADEPYTPFERTGGGRFMDQFRKCRASCLTTRAC